MRILVTGASGYVGGQLVPKLISAGHAVRCVVRDPKTFQPPWKNDVTVVQADLLRNDEALRFAVTDVDVAYYLIHSMSGGAAGFEERDRQAARNFASAAKSAGVARLIYLGGLGSHTAKLSSHLRSRQETGEVLREFGPPVTEFRAAIIVGNGSISFEIIRNLTERLPVMICPSWVDTRVQPIAINDVVDYLVTALEIPATQDRVIEIGGSSIETYHSMMLTFARLRGLRRLLIRVPVLTPRLSSYWLNFVTPISASIARPLIEGLRNEVICHDPAALELFPGIRPIDYEAAVRAAAHEHIPFDALAPILQKSANEPSHALIRAQGFIFDKRESILAVPLEKVFSVVEGIGGKRGWMYADSLWQFRGAMDRVIGGVGMRRGRPHPDQLQVGETLDFWRVEVISRPYLLRLRADMKVPGQAWLQFECLALSPKQTKLRTLAIFEPLGLVGELYWAVTYPAHQFIFDGMHRAISSAAEK